MSFFTLQPFVWLFWADLCIILSYLVLTYRKHSRILYLTTLMPKKAFFWGLYISKLRCCRWVLLMRRCCSTDATSTGSSSTRSCCSSGRPSQCVTYRQTDNVIHWGAPPLIIDGYYACPFSISKLIKSCFLDIWTFTSGPGVRFSVPRHVVLRCLKIFVVIGHFSYIEFNIAFMDTVGTIKKMLRTPHGSCEIQLSNYIILFFSVCLL